MQYKAKKVNYIKNMIWGIDMKILKRIGIVILCIILLFIDFRIPYHIANTPKYPIYKYFQSLTNKDLEAYNNVNFHGGNNEEKDDIFIYDAKYILLHAKKINVPDLGLEEELRELRKMDKVFENYNKEDILIYKVSVFTDPPITDFPPGLILIRNKVDDSKSKWLVLHDTIFTNYDNFKK